MKQGEALYQRIYEQLKDAILAGKFVKGERLPTEKELTEQYFVSRITAKRAMDQLADEGVIIRIAGKGSFIAKDYPQQIVHPMAGRRMIALVMGGYSASFGLEIVNGAIDRAEELGCHLIVKRTGSTQEKETQILSHLKESGVAGIIMQTVHGEMYNPWVLNAVYNRYPIVMLDRNLPGIDAPYVGVDNVNLSKQIGLELFRRGHRNISLIMLEDDYSSSLKDRVDGFIEASLDMGTPIHKDLWMRRLWERAEAAGISRESPESHEIYVQAIAEHLLRHPEITAVYGTEYRVSVAAWDAARRIGRRVPQDMSIVSFDFNPGNLGAYVLTHVEQPQREMGAAAVEMLIEILKGNEPEKRHHLFDGKWVEGNSLADCPAKAEG